MAEKPHINIITAGHVDHGKSTLIGRLLYDSGSIPEAELRKLREKAKELKKETFEFAFIMDSLKEERERGLTIDLMYKPIITDKYYFTVIDCPGHRDFIKNMITGASQADAAILVVSAKDGVQEQTKEHLYLARVLGINQLIVAINKMDTVDYSESKFNEVKEQVSKLLQTVGYKVEKIPFVPVSAYEGDNVVKKSDNLSWYKGTPLLETMDTVIEPPEKPIDKPLRLPIQDVYTITGVGTVPVGRVETGVLKQNDKVIFMPSNVTGEVKSIEMHHKQIDKAEPGDNIGFNIRGVSRQQIKRGDVVGHPDNPPTVVKEFTAQIIVLQHPTVITKGYTPVFHAHTAHIACRITELVKKIDPKTGATVQENPDMLKSGDAAVIKCEPTQPMVLEKQSDFPQLAKFAIRDMGKTIAAGIVLDVVPAK
ncbi:MAG: translation elongation factor EF-1 subunit alpha [Candidatus Aenigmatarchaeota archaeon]|nr:MAG: translation elongation factor EF-1 subunit alpha [Candidatus Aenigmarchaeota archaeon]RLJ07964.1 MAG: translation elongation factor EF-1 subunit alpha [Candidatus Aenigmarchaeota archaeon]RLJ08385.1 MAG: translation elongation factor EF-1 subunit alpha [Candidatus Aenigmarchaeota archaeon]